MKEHPTLTLLTIAVGFGICFLAFIHNQIWLLCFTLGAYLLAGAICDWDWFMESSEAREWVNILSHKGARIFYGLLGLASIILGLLDILGVIDLQIPSGEQVALPVIFLFHDAV